MILLVAGMAASCGGPLPLEKKELEESEAHQFPASGHEAEQQKGERAVIKASELLIQSKRIPEEAAHEHNPLKHTEKNIETGRIAYATECARCHGEIGFGDGDSARGMDPPPTDLHEEHVQALPDGALFWIVAHGVKGSSMPSFEARLEEDQIWRLVLYLRTFGELKSPALVE